jgi:hypothetical protein
MYGEKVAFRGGLFLFLPRPNSVIETNLVVRHPILTSSL